MLISQKLMMCTLLIKSCNIPHLDIFLLNGLVMAINWLYRGSMYSQGAQQREITRVISVSVGFGLCGLEDMAAGSAPRSTWNPGHVRELLVWSWLYHGFPMCFHSASVRPGPSLLDAFYAPAGRFFSKCVRVHEGGKWPNCGAAMTRLHKLN